MSDERSRRARARASWPGTRTTLDAIEEIEVLALPPEELIPMVRVLTLAAWALKGEPMPTYARADAPGRIIRAGDR